MRKFWILISVCWLWTCGGGDSPTEPIGPNYVVNLSNLGGSAQKGPFNNGTSINIAELSNALAPTGKNYSSQITDNSGRFNVAQVQLESPYVELRANGFYFNEVTNKISDAQLTLYALSDLTGKTSLNVNILTHLEKNRIINLMSGDNPLTYAQAKLQAQEEVLNIFEYSRANMLESELLDISKSGSANGKLLAISAILQGDQTVGQMSELLANISTDITADGTIENTTIRNTLINNAANLDFEQIRSNLVARYASLGVSATIPDFETEINMFLKPPVANNMNVSTDEDNPINITLDASDPEGESLTFQIVETNNATVNINGNIANYTPDANFNGTDTFTYFANDGTVNSNTATVTITVGAVDDDPNTNDVAITTDEDTEVVFTLSADEYDGDSYSFALTTQPSNGSASLDGSTVTYSPNENWNGTDTFTFEASDNTGRIRNVATATITVNPVNDAPVLVDRNETTDENNAITFSVLSDVTDIDSDGVSYHIVSQPSNGAVTIATDLFTYTPNDNWNGTDTFKWKVNDGSLDSNTATVTVTVNPMGQFPNAVDYGLSNQVEIVTWNIRQFPQHSTTKDYVKDLLETWNADIYVLQEINQESELANLVDSMPNYSYVISEDSQNLQFALVYKNQYVTFNSKKELWASSSSNTGGFGGRFPMESFITWSDGSNTVDLFLIAVQYRCCNNDISRHNASLLLTDYIINDRSEDEVIVLGDFNNISQDILNPTLSPFTDVDNFNSASSFKFVDSSILDGPSSGYSWQGWSSSYSAHHLDHIFINNKMFSYSYDFKVISLLTETELTGYVISSYISDHQPLIYRFIP